ncbi:MAG: DHA2 family efflux MFS transporter permease subunit [Rhodospirillaceae bacterium]|jgi:MFS transporter, DHA2 family, multidrug resistance protein|nr:DHA2 family efflux MFS transporter permease subunit [Rhodospirillaceae bacterium]
MSEMTSGRRRAILLTLMVTVGTYVLTVTVANVSLPQLQGAFAATQDQITWVVTSNLLATAIATPMSGWLDGRFGRRRVLLWATSLFTVATLLCGLATSLEELVVLRAVQGFSGAPLLPLSQAIILNIYPRNQHGRVLVIWSMGVTIGSILAPLAGGYMSEDYSWRWVFLMVVPAAVLCIGALWVFIENPKEGRQPSRLDWFGFIFLAIAVSGLQLMLDRGQRLDWFDSPEIIIEAIVAIGGFYLFVAHVLTTDRPFLNPKLLLDRNYAVGIVLGLAFGMLYFTTMVLQPTMLQDLRGYPDSLIGIFQAIRGVGLLGGSIFLLVFLKNLDPRFNLFLGFLTQGAAGYAMSLFDINMTLWALTWTTMLQGFGVGMMWSPITVVTFATLNPRHVPEAASVFHLLRNIGSSVHIAISATLVVRSGTISYAEMIEALNPFNETLAFNALTGVWSIGNESGLASLGGEIGRQAAMIGYVNAYYAYALAAMVAMPLAFLARRPQMA